jgi:phage shock protein PspC (stress-responsive transcriptional regulator)
MDDDMTPSDVTPPTDSPEPGDAASEPAATDAAGSTPDTATPEVTTPKSSRRLHRSASHRIIGGVAGGLGERFDLDANIFRVIFVLFSIAWGFGVLIYLALWILMPRDPNGEPAPADRPVRERSESNWTYIALSVALIIVALIAWSALGHGHPYLHGPGVGRGLFLLWVLFLVVLAFVALRGSSRRVSLGRVIAVFFISLLTLVILTAGGLLTYLATTGVPMTGGTGERSWTPTSLATTGHTYRTEFGSSIVDLREVQFPASGFRVYASVAIGNLTIDVPNDAVVDLHTHVGAGSAFFGRMTNYGWEPVPFIGVPAGLSGAQVARAPHLWISAQVGIGHLDILRGPVVTPANP